MVSAAVLELVDSITILLIIILKFSSFKCVAYLVPAHHDPLAPEYYLSSTHTKMFNTYFLRTSGKCTIGCGSSLGSLMRAHRRQGSTVLPS